MLFPLLWHCTVLLVHEVAYTADMSRSSEGRTVVKGGHRAAECLPGEVLTNDGCFDIYMYISSEHYAWPELTFRHRRESGTSAIHAAHSEAGV